MRRILPFLLTGFLLLTQVGLVLHGYQDHSTNEVCDLCLAGSQHNDVLVSALPHVLIASVSLPRQEILPDTHLELTQRRYTIRAPPLSL